MANTYTQILNNIHLLTSLYPTLALSGAGDLMYLEGAGGTRGGRHLVWVERDGAARAIDPSWTGVFESVALSPSGTRLAATLGTQQDSDLWIKQLDRGPASHPAHWAADRSQGLIRRAG